MQRITYKDRLDKPQPVISVAERLRVYLTCRQAHRQAENESAVRYALPKKLRFAPFRIHVVRIEITCLSRMQNDIRLGNSSTQSLSGRTNYVILKMPTSAHSSTP